jgi:hypothetical protein
MVHDRYISGLATSGWGDLGEGYNWGEWLGWFVTI